MESPKEESYCGTGWIFWRQTHSLRRMYNPSFCANSLGIQCFHDDPSFPTTRCCSTTMFCLNRSSVASWNTNVSSTTFERIHFGRQWLVSFWFARQESIAWDFDLFLYSCISTRLGSHETLYSHLKSTRKRTIHLTSQAISTWSHE